MKIKKLTVNNKNKDKQFLIGTENYIKMHRRITSSGITINNEQKTINNSNQIKCKKRNEQWLTEKKVKTNTWMNWYLHWLFVSPYLQS